MLAALIYLLQIISKLSVDTPPPALVDGYLKEIAKAYGVHFSIPGEEIVEVTDEDQVAIDNNEVCSRSDRIVFGHQVMSFYKGCKENRRLR